MDEPENVNDTNEATPVTSLHRSSTKKVFGGVAGGIGERFDIDANIVRVVFVVLTLAYGLGAAVYLAMWALIPRSPSSESDEVEQEEVGHIRANWLKYALPVGVLVIVVIFLATIGGTHEHGDGFSLAGWRFAKALVLLWLLFLIVLAVASLRLPSRRLTLRRFVALAFLSFLSFIILVTGSFLLVLQVIGVPLEGGSGVKSWRPTTVAQVQHQYHGAIGESTVNLLQVPFTSGTYSITVTEGVGVINVDVPANATIDLRTHVGIGKVWNYTVRRFDSPTTTSTPHGPHLVLNLQVGVGRIDVYRYTN
jgi:phage shock protein C